MYWWRRAAWQHGRYGQPAAGNAPQGQRQAHVLLLVLEREGGRVGALLHRRPLQAEHCRHPGSSAPPCAEPGTRAAAPVRAARCLRRASSVASRPQQLPSPRGCGPDSCWPHAQPRGAPGVPLTWVVHGAQAEHLQQVTLGQPSRICERHALAERRHHATHDVVYHLHKTAAPKGSTTGQRAGQPRTAAELTPLPRSQLPPVGAGWVHARCSCSPASCARPRPSRPAGSSSCP